MRSPIKFRPVSVGCSLLVLAFVLAAARCSTAQSASTVAQAQTNSAPMTVAQPPAPIQANQDQTNVSGLFGLQIEGTPCKGFFRDLWLRKID
jgi:hypothetical protein